MRGGPPLIVAAAARHYRRSTPTQQAIRQCNGLMRLSVRAEPPGRHRHGGYNAIKRITHRSRIAHTTSAAYLHRGVDNARCLRPIAVTAAAIVERIDRAASNGAGDLVRRHRRSGRRHRLRPRPDVRQAGGGDAQGDSHRRSDRQAGRRRRRSPSRRRQSVSSRSGCDSVGEYRALLDGLLRCRAGTDLQHRRLQAGILAGSG